MAVFDANYQYWDGHTFAVGDFALAVNQIWRCTQAHTASVLNQPYYGSQWKNYWEQAITGYSDPAEGGDGTHKFVWTAEHCLTWNGYSSYTEGRYCVHDTNGVGDTAGHLVWVANKAISAPVGEPPTPNDPPGTSPDWDYAFTCNFLPSEKYLQPQAWAGNWYSSYYSTVFEYEFMANFEVENYPYDILYQCSQQHNPSATNEPGVGSSWQDYWNVVADGPYTPLGHFEIQGSFNITRSANIEREGGFLVCDANGKLIFRIAAFEAGGAIYSDMDEYAQDQGFADEAELLTEWGYSTSLELAQAKGFLTVETYLSAQSYPTVVETLAELGITLG